MKQGAIAISIEEWEKLQGPEYLKAVIPKEDMEKFAEEYAHKNGLRVIK